MRLIRKFFKWIFKEEYKRMIELIVDVQESSARALKNTKECYECSKEIIEEAKHVIQYVEQLKASLGCLDISCDVSYYGKSWAVISLQGEKEALIKFIDLRDRDLREICQFLSRYDRVKVDANPQDVHRMNEIIHIMKDK